MNTKKAVLVLGVGAFVLAGLWLGWGAPGSSPATPALAVEAGARDIEQNLVAVGLEPDREARVTSEVLEEIAQNPEREPEVVLPTRLATGQLEVLVLLDGTPVDSGRVHVFNGGPNAFPRDFDKTRKGMFHALIGFDGWARFQGIPAGFLNVAAEVEPGYCQYVQPSMKRDEGMRVVIRMETTGIMGRVYDEHGATVEGAMVFIDGPSEAPQSTTWTDANGQYSLRGMPAGPVEVTMTRHGHFYLPSGGERRKAIVDSEQTLELDFGNPNGWPRWTGAIRNAAGELVHVARRPVFKGSLILRERSTGAFRQVRIADDGSFDIGLEPGTYEVSVQVGSAKTQPVLEHELVMPDRNLHRELVLPGAILRGQLREDGSGFDPGETMNESVALYRKDGPRGPPDHAVNIGRDGKFVFSGLQPGTYRVRTHPRKIAENIELVVLESDTELVLDLDLLPISRRR